MAPTRLAAIATFIEVDEIKESLDVRTLGRRAVSVSEPWGEVLAVRPDFAFDRKRGGGIEKTAAEKALEKKVPQPFRVGAHHWLILHGRYICKARTPECWRCPVVDLCAFKPKVLEPKRK